MLRLPANVRFVVTVIVAVTLSNFAVTGRTQAVRGAEIESTGGDAWPQFRGPNGNGVVDGQQGVPIEFGEHENLMWRTQLPGRGWSSPVIADGRVWVTTAVERLPSEAERLEMLKASGVSKENELKQRAIARSIDLKLIALDLQTGSILQTVDLTSVDQPDPIHTLNSYASPTPMIDGDRIYCHFGTYGTFCVDRTSGEIVWQRTMPLEHSVGPGSSPFVYKDMLVLIQDGVDRQYVAALNKYTGETIWERDRPEMEAPDGDRKKAYSTPIAIVDKSGREQLICMASQWMVSYDPATGDELWRAYHGKGFSVVPRPVYSDGIVYFATGFAKPELWAVDVSGQGDVTETHVRWTVPRGIPDKPSPLLHDGLIYLIDDSGVASCLESSTGELVWKKRIGGDYSASPVLAGGYLFLASHDGKVTVLKPGRVGEVLAENQLDGKIMASPAVVDNTLIIRTDRAVYRFANLARKSN